jgi:hypothetical protein
VRAVFPEGENNMRKATFLSVRALGMLVIALALVATTMALGVASRGPQSAAAQVQGQALFCVPEAQFGTLDVVDDGVLDAKDFAVLTEAGVTIPANLVALAEINTLRLGTCDSPTIIIDQGGGDDDADGDGAPVIDIDQGNCPDNGDGGQDVEVGEGTPVIDIDQRNCPDETPDVVETPVVTETPTPVVGETGDVEIAKLFCFNAELAGQVEFEVFDPEFPVEATGVTAQAGTVQPDNCVPGAAEFEIFPFGDRTAEPFAVTVGSDGVIVIDDIISVTGEGEAHLIVELSTGAEAFFEVAAGADTKIIVINFIGEEEVETPVPGETPGEGEQPGGTTGGGVVTLPDTGAGAGQSGAEYGMALFLVLGGLAAAGVSLRRRAA